MSDKALSRLAMIIGNAENMREIAMEAVYIYMAPEDHDDESMERRREIAREIALELRATAELVEQLEDDMEDD